MIRGKFPTQTIPPDGPQIGPPDPFNTPSGEIPEGPDEGGEEDVFPETPEPVVDTGDTGTTVADAGGDSGADDACGGESSEGDGGDPLLHERDGAFIRQTLRQVR